MFAQQVPPPTDTDLKAAYCVGVEDQQVARNKWAAGTSGPNIHRRLFNTQVIDLDGYMAISTDG
ncbi:protein of unknown function [Paraburkholderia kururiensis]